jgi:hypothetical protein
MAEKEVKKNVVTNKEFSSTNAAFQAACIEAQIEPTTRQASKWRMGKGKAYKTAR